MAEAVGVAAAAAQFAELAFKIVKAGRDIYDQLQNAPEQISKSLGQIDMLRNIVSDIENCPELQTKEVERILEGCMSKGQELHDALSKIHFSLDDPLSQRTWKAVIGKTRETELRNLFEELEHNKSTLIARITVSFGADSSNQLRKILSGMQELNMSNSAETDENKCLRSLFVTDPAQDRDDMIDAKGEICAGTCEWIISTQEFKEWDQQPPHLLWISAPPGMGKTYMSIYLSRHFERLAEQTDTKVLFFFCDNKVASRNTAANILRGLLYQLIMHQRDLIHIMLPQWKIQSSDLFQGNSLNTLWKFFEEMINKVRAKTVYCIIDALDECEANSLSSLLRKFEMLSKSPETSTAKMKLVCLSRRYPENIPAALSSFFRLKLDVIPARKKDTRRFTSQRVNELAQKQLDSRLQAHVEKTLQEKSEGTFLWISFMAQDLESTSIEEIEASLQLLPQGLDAVYERILSHIKPDKIQIVSKMIDWIRVAARPLRVPELCEAIGLRPTDLLSREQVCISLIRSCGHLLQVTRNAKTIWYNEGTLSSSISNATADSKHDVLNYWPLEVTFLHQSAKDYFTKSSKVTRLKYEFGFTNQLHETISDQLITYIFDHETNVRLWRGQNVVIESPLCVYARRFWSFHFKELDDISRLINQNERLFGKRSNIRNHLAIYWYESGQNPIPLLHMACILGLNNLTKWCLERRRIRNQVGLMSDLTKRWCGCAPLSLAYNYKREDIAKLLLDAGADPLALDDYSASTPFESALFNCGQDAWHHLAATKRGKKWLDPCNQPLYTLSKLAEGGVADACRFLVEEHGWDVNRGNPLVGSLRGGRVKLARTFADKWHACIGDHYELLKAVCQIQDNHDFQEAINLLVDDWSVDINATNYQGCTILCEIFQSPLWRAGSDSIVSRMDMAIRAGADAGKPNSNGQIPLHCAAQSDHFSAFHLSSEAIKVVSHNGQSHINVVCGAGRTILHHFISRIVSFGRLKVWHRADFKLFLKNAPASLVWLLDFGLDRYIKDTLGNSALDLLRRDRASGLSVNIA
ncbi:hypothetical protein B0J13DRAFT_77389 [Dactylonectria estremocensis]|uniref:Nephrocystin 3-like N-terminal domain-containing protein n=1 Tax=Dactylonectria estremocensis TaxID=1079267 RepID=A0A9P9EII5_9HYPO|nr:hypothetical protein B0J13DRAFT_77389 [Dactylonectria estremocensis]